MLLELAQWLAKDVRLFNVFNYITLRAVLSCLTALAIPLRSYNNSRPMRTLDSWRAPGHGISDS